MITRPFSITLTALVLAWFSFGSLLGGLLTITGDQGGLPIPLALSLALIAFGLVAGLGARAAWRMLPTAPRLFLLVGIACGVVAIALTLTVSPPVPAAKAWTACILGTAAFGLALAWKARHIRRLLRGAA